MSEYPPSLMIRDTAIHDDAGGLGQRIYTTAGAGYEKVKYIRADLSPQWQPIDSAKPNDLDKALLWDNGDPVVGEYLAVPGQWYDQEMRWLEMVTHWTPLGDPPT